MPEIDIELQSLEDAICLELIPALTGQNHLSDELCNLLALPTREQYHATEYIYESVTDFLMDNVTLVFLNGTPPSSLKEYSSKYMMRIETHSILCALGQRFKSIAMR